jgi:pyruvate dehydrogenase complex dehydrogenase (E1) component
MTDNEQQTPPPSDIIDIENREWRESLEYVYRHQGPQRVMELLRQLQTHAQERGATFSCSANTPYINTIALNDSRYSRAVATSSGASKALSAGTPWPWSCAPTADDGIGGHISPLLPAPPCSKSVSTIFSMPERRSTPAMRSISRGMRRRAFTRGHSWKGA